MSWLSAAVAPGAFRTRGSAGHTGMQTSTAVQSRTRQAQQGFWKVHAEGSNRRKAPWKIGFDIRERETMWTDENKARLVRLMASRELKIPLEQLERRMDELLTLVPDLALLENVDVIVLRLLALKEILPAANISALVAKHPDLLLQDPSWVAVQAERSRALLGVDAIDKIAEKEPRFLDAEGVQEALDELELLMGKSTDVQELLVRDPSFLLKVERGEKRLGDAPDKGSSGDLMKDP